MTKEEVDTWNDWVKSLDSAQDQMTELNHQRDTVFLLETIAILLGDIAISLHKTKDDYVLRSDIGPAKVS